MAREQQLRQYAENLKRQPPQEDAPKESEASDVDDIVEKYHTLCLKMMLLRQLVC
jgi:L-lysine 2,3-aminomutase